jgi:hypothetical protein
MFLSILSIGTMFLFTASWLWTMVNDIVHFIAAKVCKHLSRDCRGPLRLTHLDAGTTTRVLFLVSHVVSTCQILQSAPADLEVWWH